MPTTPQPSMYDLFLSHGSPDKPWVRALYERLTAAGVVAYLDEVAIDAGDNFVCNLSDGIGHTSTFVIVVSQGAMDRPWVEHEWTSFMATHGPRNRIIPVLLDDVVLPPFLRPFQVIRAIDRNVVRIGVIGIESDCFGDIGQRTINIAFLHSSVPAIGTRPDILRVETNCLGEVVESAIHGHPSRQECSRD